MILLILSLCACNSGIQGNSRIQGNSNNSSPTIKTENSFPSSKIISLGSPYSSMSDIVLSGFPIDSLAESTLLKIGATNQEIIYSTSTNQIASSAGITGDVSLRGSVSNVQGSIVANFIDSLNSDTFHITYFYSFSNFIPVSLYDPTLKAIFSNGSPLNEYGDAFVSSLNMGLFAGLYLEFSSNSITAINALNAAVSIMYKEGNSLDIDALLNNIDSKTKSQISLNLQGIQLGGDPVALIEALGIPQADTSQDGLENSIKRTCSKDQFNECLAIIERFESYAHGEYNNQVQKYIMSLYKKDKIEYNDIKSTLFPLNNTLANIKIGKYIDIETNDIYNPPVDYTMSSKLNDAEIKFSQILSQITTLRNIQTLTFNYWQVESFNYAENSLTQSYKDLTAVVKSYCVGSSREINATTCTKKINQMLNNSVNPAIAYSLNLINSFKGFKLSSLFINANTYLVYIGGNNFLCFTLPTDYMDSRISPGIWRLTNDGYIETSSIFDIDSTHDVYASISPGLKALLSNQDGMPILTQISGVLMNKAGDSIDITQNLSEIYLPVTW